MTGNTAANGGGGILNEGYLTLQSDSSVSGNTTGGTGGGILTHTGSDTRLQSGSSVSDNRAGREGGGISNHGGITLQSGSRVTGNTASDVGGISNYGYATIEAGAIICNNTPLTNQCAGGPSSTFEGPCPNPSDGICPS